MNGGVDHSLLECRGWEPDSGEVTELLSSLEVFLHRAFIVGQKALSIQSSIPAKPKRERDAAKR